MLRDAEMQENTGAVALYHGDGLLDIFAGVGIVLFGAAMLAELPWLVAIFPAISLPVWRDAKRSLTVPRLRQADWAPAQETVRRARVVTMTLIGLLALSLGVGFTFFLGMGAVPSGAEVWLRQHFPLALGTFLAALAAVMSLVLRVSRFYVYAAATLAAFAAAQWLGLSVPVATVASGAGILLGGLVVLIRFVRTYPAPGGNGQ